MTSEYSWPEDFNWKHRLTVLSPAIAGWIVGWIWIIAGFIAGNQYGTLGKVVIGFFCIMLGGFMWITGAQITQKWQENLSEVNTNKTGESG